MSALPDCSCPPMATCERHGVVKTERPKRKRQPGTSLAYKSEKQEIKEARWAGIKDAFLFLARRYEQDGKAHCEECGVAGDARSLDLHHLRRRSQGGAFEARNAMLVCRPCHQRLTGETQFTGGTP